jgi:hypothetical protein
MNVRFLLSIGMLATIAATGCSIKRFAVNRVGDALAGSGTTFASDDDPDLIQGAVPFSLKMIESLLAESPRHRGLLFAACSNFTQYAYAFVAEDADEMEDQDLDKAMALRARARRLYLRARDYGLRGLEVRHRDFGKAIRANPKAAVALTKRSDVPLLYWTAAAWGLAISVSKDVPELVADQPQVEALIDRALALDEDYDFGAIHGFWSPTNPAAWREKGNSRIAPESTSSAPCSFRAGSWPDRWWRSRRLFPCISRTARSFSPCWSRRWPSTRIPSRSGGSTTWSRSAAPGGC